MYQRDVDMFQPNNWLNDSCISYSFRKIEDKLDLSSHVCDVILMDPALMSFMMIQATDDEDNEELASSLNVANKTWLIVPVNDNSSFSDSSTHWSLLVCHIPSGSMYSFDSHRNSNRQSTAKTATRVCKLLGRSVNAFQRILHNFTI